MSIVASEGIKEKKILLNILRRGSD